MTTENKFILNYLPLRARAEPIRMVFHYGGIVFEDKIYQLSDWPKAKEIKAIAPFGQLPSLQLPNGETIAETGAIIRLAAKLANIYPADVFEAAKADMLWELVMDLNMINPIFNFFPMDSEKWQTSYDAFFATFPAHLSNLVDLLGEKAYFGGNNPHHGDFGIFHILSLATAVKPSVLADYPTLQAFVARVASIPSMVLYLKNRLSDKEIGVPGSFVASKKTYYILK